ncbi:hypothetical protein OUE_0224 [Helicobacter pylori R030b]|nr:hypothetical protein OUE_0224 [Helicobacter pylori R030b]
MRKASDFLITRSYGVRGILNGVKGESYFKIPPCFLMSLNKLNEFYYKMKSKTIK